MKSFQPFLLFGACLFLKALFSNLEYTLVPWEQKRLQHRAVITAQKMTRITPNTDTFYAMKFFRFPADLVTFTKETFCAVFI